jgi:Domain of unknown function (DUF2017)
VGDDAAGLSVLYRRQFTRGRHGEIKLRLRPEERDLLEMLCEELRQRIDEDPGDGELRRLFPPAHQDDPEADAEYRRMVGSQLVGGRNRALDTVERTLGQSSLSPEEAESWLTVLNDLRLVLGTRLDVTEDMSFDFDTRDPGAQELAVYGYLSWLQEQLVEAIGLGFR